MKINSFKNFKHFSANENWGDISYVSWEHVYFLNFLRSKLGYPFKVNYSYETVGHSKNSYHAKGKATDGYFKTNKNLFKQYLAINRILEEYGLLNFIGIGVYPEWNNPGFHFDTRGKQIHWIRLNDKYIYGDPFVCSYLKEIYNGS